MIEKQTGSNILDRKVNRETLIKWAAGYAIGAVIAGSKLDTVAALASSQTENQTAKESLQKTTLRELADRKGVRMGALYNVHGFPGLKSLIKREFNTVVNAGYLNWNEQGAEEYGLRSKEGEDQESWNWSKSDAVMRFAEWAEMPVEAHHLVWGWRTKVPDWLYYGFNSPEALMDIVHNHVTAVVGRYKGKVNVYSVVNEPFSNRWNAGTGMYKSEDFWALNSPRTNGIDPDYIAVALQAARDADPDAKLMLNDFNNEYINDRSTAMYELISRLKDAGTPVDGVGMQMHITPTDEFDDDFMAGYAESILANIVRFKQDLGVDVYITEMDVKIHKLSGDREARLKTQAMIYKYITQAALQYGACRNIAIFGTSDDAHPDTWVDAPWSGGDESDPTLFDDLRKPKPALNAVKEVLETLPDINVEVTSA